MICCFEVCSSVCDTQTGSSDIEKLHIVQPEAAQPNGFPLCNISANFKNFLSVNK